MHGGQGEYVGVTGVFVGSSLGDQVHRYMVPIYVLMKWRQGEIRVITNMPLIADNILHIQMVYETFQGLGLV